MILIGGRTAISIHYRSAKTSIRGPSDAQRLRSSVGLVWQRCEISVLWNIQRSTITGTYFFRTNESHKSILDLKSRFSLGFLKKYISRKTKKLKIWEHTFEVQKIISSKFQHASMSRNDVVIQLKLEKKICVTEIKY